MARDFVRGVFLKFPLFFELRPKNKNVKISKRVSNYLRFSHTVGLGESKIGKGVVVDVDRI